MKTSRSSAALLLASALCFSCASRPDLSRVAWVSPDGVVLAGGNPVDEGGRVRNFGRSALHLYRTDAADPRGTVLVLPGGGYGALAVGHEGATVATFLNKQGFDAAVLEYPIAKGGRSSRDAALIEAQKAWKLLVAQGYAKDGSMGLHTQRLGLMGFSAGGHLAARLTEQLGRAKERQPDDLVLVYPAYLDERAPGSVMPAILPPQTPTGRLLVVIAANDRPEWVKNAEIYAKTWRGYGAQASFVLLKDGGHGFGMKADLPGDAASWPEKFKAFLDAPPLAPAVNTAVIPKPSPGTRHDEKVAAAKREKFDLILVGDSITHTTGEMGGKYAPLRAVWNQFFAPRHALNLGYSGYRTENILWNLENGELEGQSPKVVTLMIGTNNVDEKNYPIRHSAPQLAEGIKAIVAVIQRKCPDAKVLLIRPFPGSYDGPLPTSHRLILERAGDILKGFADGEHVFYADVNGAFLKPDQSLDSSLFFDNLHPNAEGARRWATALDPTLSKLMGDASHMNGATVPMAQLEGDGYDWLARHEDAVKTGKTLDPEIVFIGDSITHALGGVPATGKRTTGEQVAQETFPGRRILNLGFGWDRTQNVLWRLDHGELDGTHPKAVVVHIGTNNTSTTNNAYANTPEEIAEGIRAVCRKVKQKAPQAKLILMAVFPREESPTNPRRKTIMAVNALLPAVAKEAGATLMDIGPKFLREDGTLPREMMGDFCHPTAAGYRVWMGAIKAEIPE